MKKICFVANGSDYHAVDWYMCVKDICSEMEVRFATDALISEDGRKLLSATKDIIQLVRTDSLLKSEPSKIANLWRNVFKIVIMPLFSFRLNRLSKKDKYIFHAHSMYYIVVCAFARIDFIATPMGSDVLVRPDHSWLYKLFTIYALKRASLISVDSKALQEKIHHLTGKSCVIIQNGISTDETEKYRGNHEGRQNFVSFRAIDVNYRVSNLFEVRNATNVNIDLILIYPYYNSDYRSQLLKQAREGDSDLGRLSKKEMYSMFESACAVFSIPISDSSPRSVYEAIFCGAPVVVTYDKWIEDLPQCMRSRLIIVDVTNHDWLNSALSEAKAISKIRYQPSSEALLKFDQRKNMEFMCTQFYKGSY